MFYIALVFLLFSCAKTWLMIFILIEPRDKKSCLRGLRPVNTQTCSAIETSMRLESLDIETRGIILSN